MRSEVKKRERDRKREHWTNQYRDMFAARILHNNSGQRLSMPNHGGKSKARDKRIG
jgi:hypothetical protein